MDSHQIDLQLKYIKKHDKKDYTANWTCSWCKVAYNLNYYCVISNTLNNKHSAELHQHIFTRMTLQGSSRNPVATEEWEDRQMLTGPHELEVQP